MEAFGIWKSAGPSDDVSSILMRSWAVPRNIIVGLLSVLAASSRAAIIFYMLADEYIA
jgi:hypothetical protein